ncbi:hypothetical protein TGME49_221180 [Toxoplasma gondii ME49]|uniref:Transmembrane protein n=3 Tax=Toxoplasma gondii TaxID=5811 RepID=S8FDY9_TOXGM|nr:hypothetical protein TGME49_221180 [Toxoplasma gondii ME49]EPT31953.1 hypothetical protein TGME49_221180 [Toxoplasma gondii ME49]|eukprot:XP_002369948.1 hypothetical protein TGME49_221180 [Toxoplasma gondii ME49]
MAGSIHRASGVCRCIFFFLVASLAAPREGCAVRWRTAVQRDGDGALRRLAPAVVDPSKNRVSVLDHGAASLSRLPPSPAGAADSSYPVYAAGLYAVDASTMPATVARDILVRSVPEVQKLPSEPARASTLSSPAHIPSPSFSPDLVLHPPPAPFSRVTESMPGLSKPTSPSLLASVPSADPSVAAPQTVVAPAPSTLPASGVPLPQTEAPARSSATADSVPPQPIPNFTATPIQRFSAPLAPVAVPALQLPTGVPRLPLQADLQKAFAAQQPSSRDSQVAQRLSDLTGNTNFLTAATPPPAVATLSAQKLGSAAADLAVSTQTISGVPVASAPAVSATDPAVSTQTISGVPVASAPAVSATNPAVSTQTISGVPVASAPAVSATDPAVSTQTFSGVPVASAPAVSATGPAVSTASAQSGSPRVFEAPGAFSSRLSSGVSGAPLAGAAADGDSGAGTGSPGETSSKQDSGGVGTKVDARVAQQPVHLMESKGDSEKEEGKGRDAYWSSRVAPAIPLVSESVPAPAVAILAHAEEDTSSCIDRCDCVPIVLGGVASLVTCIIVVVLAAVLMSQVFSKGFFSSMFFRGGGFAILLSASVGLLGGGLTGGLVRGCWPGALYLGGGLMAFSVSVVLLGKRGAGVGAVGGLLAGASTAALIHPGALSVSLGCLVGFLLGIVVGFAPIFRELKMNSRYIRYGFESRQQSLNAQTAGAPESVRSDSFPGRQRLPFRMFSSPTKPASVRTAGSAGSESEPENRRADSLPSTRLSPRL